mmetsp:Transcript_22962/g.39393  ORF Transcript_22962/g.39393 Transcript_22962/m.39393 type:complete len:205 (+) Transcript_22962:134-748(+)|eukprot:CAMPEP_0196665554 /NCGR_PEP_ID=MMETSP1086-20130531/61520_1 /TAXON_ID=77921 /ORGANISM="Cyanoptyche  gloeocystis , Strain SAG4.97" /LENGTH=204 /DNA_ID=CAMNT_0042002367 /DNA_START=132 /DNA_END=746 /DNA_ORIENTATION=+
MPAKVLILFYSTYGHVYQLAKAVAEGVKEAGAEAVIKRVPETLPADVLAKLGAVEAQKQFASVPIATVDELPSYDAIIFGTPTRFGAMAGQLRTFLDATGGLWMKGALVGKVGSVFTSTATQHGGQETTLISTITSLLHHGFVIVGLPYTFQAQTTPDQIIGCSPYGASTVAGGKGERSPHQIDLDGAKFQGKHVAQIATKLIA